MAADDERAGRSLAESAYRRLVWEDPDFEAFFVGATPIDEISRMELGSRPARRASGASPSLASLRAIPWVFAWAQSRTNLPAWFGVGAALAGYVARHGAARPRSAWPSAYARMGLLQLDDRQRGARPGDRRPDRRRPLRQPGRSDSEPMRRIAATLVDERARTEEEVLRLTGSAPPARPQPAAPAQHRAAHAVRRRPVRAPGSRPGSLAVSAPSAPMSAPPPSASSSSPSTAWPPGSSTPVDLTRSVTMARP